MKFLKRSFLLLLCLMLIAAMVLSGCSESKKSKKSKGDDDDGGKKAPSMEQEAGRNDFISSIGGVSETYAGGVSELSYPSAEEAAVAYVEEEVIGTKNAVILETVSAGELSQAKVNSLNIPAELQEGMQSVEELTVTYTESDDVNLNLAASSANKTVKVYVIKYTVDWKYFTPRPVTGETVTKSYYDSVFNSEKYANCTMTTSNKIKLEMEGETTKMETVQTIQFDGNKVYMEQFVDYKMEGTSGTQKIYCYMEMVDGEIVCYIKTGDSGEWMESDLTTIGFTSLEQLRPFYDQYLDYTYFTKTDYGFILAEENATEYLKQALAASGLDRYINMDSLDMNMELYAEYYVADGILSGMRMDADLEFGAAGVTIVEEVESYTTCTKYGTTTVTNPMK